MRTDTDLFFTPGKKYDGPSLLTANAPANAKYRAPTKLIDNPDAIVIGSGIGGMSMASILAQKKHMRVLLLEASTVPGDAYLRWDIALRLGEGRRTVQGQGSAQGHGRVLAQPVCVRSVTCRSLPEYLDGGRACGRNSGLGRAVKEGRRVS